MYKGRRDGTRSFDNYFVEIFLDLIRPGAREGRRSIVHWQLRDSCARALGERASLTYISNMKTRPITVAETQAFARSAAKIWNEAELAELVDYVAHNPESGDVIQGTGGVRKLRWGKAGSGKRGGARVI